MDNHQQKFAPCVLQNETGPSLVDVANVWKINCSSRRANWLLFQCTTFILVKEKLYLCLTN
jgi:hypothetical protein